MTGKLGARMLVAVIAVGLWCSSRATLAQTIPIYTATGGPLGAGVTDGAFLQSGVIQDANLNTYGTTSLGGGSPNCNSGCGTVWMQPPGGGVVQILYAFKGLAAGVTDGWYPFGGLVMSPGGVIYGTTVYGGGGACKFNGKNSGCGTVFQLAKVAGVWKYSQIYSFSGVGNGDGQYPYGGLTLDVPGNLYGTTFAGGANSTQAMPDGFGTFFELSPPGAAWTETILHSFDLDATKGIDDGCRPEGTVVLDSVTGVFYGTAAQCGPTNDGTIWSYTPPAHPPFAVLHSFNHNLNEGSTPIAGLTPDGQGNFFGVTFGGGNNAGVGCSFNQVNGCGTVFEYTLKPAGFKTLHSFVGTDGMGPMSTLVHDCHGVLWGTTFLGGNPFVPPQGANKDGTVFSIVPGGAFTKLFDLNFDLAHGPNPGDGPIGDMFQNFEGMVFGVTSYGGKIEPGYGAGCGLAYELGAIAADIHDFTGLGAGKDGMDSLSNLVADKAGNLYGTTSSGGANGKGTFFEVVPPAAPGGAYVVLDLHDFGAAGDGATPTTGVVIDNRGNIWGTTSAGGAFGDGTLWWWAVAAPHYAIRHNFRNALGDGKLPSGIAVDNAGGVQTVGEIYGTALQGGTGCDTQPLKYPNGCGTAWSFTPNGAFAVIWDFSGAPGDGVAPTGMLVSGGDLYGTTTLGGVNLCVGVECGTVYQLVPPGARWVENIWHNFNDPVAHEGYTPNASLVADPTGILYGTAKNGGNSFGTIFAVSPVGAHVVVVLHTFLGGGDGATPLSGLLGNFGAINVFYGTTSLGGTAGGQGLVYRYGPNFTANQYSVLHSFAANEQPFGTPYQDLCGYLFGTTQFAGANNDGYIYSLKP